MSVTSGFLFQLLLRNSTFMNGTTNRLISHAVKVSTNENCETLQRFEEGQVLRWFGFRRGSSFGNRLHLSEVQERKRGQRNSCRGNLILVISMNLLQGQWTVETNGGTLMQHGTWMKNPQFLLKVKKQGEMNIKLFQPENCEERISFYLLKYENFWDGLPKLVFSTEDLIKIDNFWAAVFAVEGFKFKTSFNLRKLAEALGINITEGKYVIIPCTENMGYAGNFSVNVWCTDATKKSKISLKQLPLKTGWNTKTFHVQILALLVLTALGLLEKGIGRGRKYQRNQMETEPPIFGVCFRRHDCNYHPLPGRERTQHWTLRCQVSRLFLDLRELMCFRFQQENHRVHQRSCKNRQL